MRTPLSASAKLCQSNRTGQTIWTHNAITVLHSCWTALPFEERLTWRRLLTIGYLFHFRRPQADWPFCGQIKDIWQYFKLVGCTIFGLAVWLFWPFFKVVWPKICCWPFFKICLYFNAKLSTTVTRRPIDASIQRVYLLGFKELSFNILETRK